MRKVKWNEKAKIVVVSTTHLPYELAEQMDNNPSWEECPFIWEKTDYGYRIWTGSYAKDLPKEIKPIMRAAKKDGFRWVYFDCDAAEQNEFKTWEW